MTVRELIAALSKCNPEGTVMFEARSEALLVLNPRPGMHPTWSDEALALSVEDEDFLGALHIRDVR